MVWPGSFRPLLDSSEGAPPQLRGRWDETSVWTTWPQPNYGLKKRTTTQNLKFDNSLKNKTKDLSVLQSYHD